MTELFWIIAAIILTRVAWVLVTRVRHRPKTRPKRRARQRPRAARRGAGVADILGWTPTRQENRDARGE